MKIKRAYHTELSTRHQVSIIVEIKALGLSREMSISAYGATAKEAYVSAWRKARMQRDDLLNVTPNRVQLAAIRYATNKILNHAGTKGAYEYKSFSVEMDYIPWKRKGDQVRVWLNTTTGLKGCDSAYSRMMLHSRRQIKIGSRGQCYLMNARKKNIKGDACFYERTW
jgi:hypothetical protein